MRTQINVFISQVTTTSDAKREELVNEAVSQFRLDEIFVQSPMVGRYLVACQLCGLSPARTLREAVLLCGGEGSGSVRDKMTAKDVVCFTKLLKAEPGRSELWLADSIHTYIVENYDVEDSLLDSFDALTAAIEFHDRSYRIAQKYTLDVLVDKTQVFGRVDSDFYDMVKSIHSAGGELERVLIYMRLRYGITDALDGFVRYLATKNGTVESNLKTFGVQARNLLDDLVFQRDFDFGSIVNEWAKFMDAHYVEAQNAPELQLPCYYR